MGTYIRRTVGEQDDTISNNIYTSIYFNNDGRTLRKIKDKRHILPQILLILACCCLSMLAALRGDTVGTDVRTYVIRYFSYAGIENNFFSFYQGF